MGCGDMTCTQCVGLWECGDVAVTRYVTWLLPGMWVVVTWLVPGKWVVVTWLVPGVWVVVT